MKQTKAADAVSLGKKRWERKSKAERLAHIKMMLKARKEKHGY